MALVFGAFNHHVYFLVPIGYAALLYFLHIARNDAGFLWSAGLLALLLTILSLVGLFFALGVLSGFIAENTEPIGWHADPDAWQRTAQFVGAGLGALTTAGAFVYICFRRREEALAATVFAIVAWSGWFVINAWT